MRDSIKMALAILVIVASLAFMVFGVASAASGFVQNRIQRSGVTYFSMGDLTATPAPAETMEPTESPEPVHVAESKSSSDDDMEESSSQSGSSEMEDDDSQEDSSSQGQDEDSGSTNSSQQTNNHHSSSSSDDDGGDD